MRKRLNHALMAAALLTPAGASLAAEENREAVDLETISITGGDEEIFTTPGSAHSIDRQELERFEYDDVQRILTTVPGVYIREEDGYGLRPNIGIRGATSDRSSKTTLLEDGILLAPAPYAAPAAYYFPMVSRMTGVEVFKGPSAIRHGPYTIGGAVNLITRSIPPERGGGIDAAIGEEGYGKLHGHFGDSGRRFGWLVEGIHLETDGFKELDGGGDTGFEKNDAMVKLRFNSDPAADVYHHLDVKLGYADEASDETYLGLSDEDFAANPYRRYAASERGHMDWDRRQVELSYYFAPGADYDLTTTIYRHDFERAWEKLNGFDFDRSLNEIFANPDAGINAIFLDVLRGERDSSSAPETLLIGTNAREYYAQGIDLTGRWWPVFAGVEHELEFGLRYHEDEIERDHTEDGFLMQDGNLVSDGSGTVVTADNTGHAEALALYLHDKITLGRFTLRGGVRTERIETRFDNRLNDTGTTNSTDIVLPGAGVFYEITPAFGVLAGVHRGFVPNGPGQADDIDPEESLNFEAGFRFRDGTLRAEMIGFFNDYSNLVGRCTFSSGCSTDQLDQEFDGGEVDIHGAELMVGNEFSISGGLRLPVSLVYTYTDSEFQSSFTSSFPQYGDVQQGDELPYLPKHQAVIRAGLGGSHWEAELALRYIGEMRDTAGQDDGPDDQWTDVQRIVDLAASHDLTRNGQLYLRVNNLLDEEYIVSRRPFGARPGQPRHVAVGYKYRF